tara:strand:+ start:55 stop:1362 length:1308 start_codon:yes stop_codon:yes gene_type:complete
MSLLDTNYQDQRLTPSQKKKIKPAIQGGGYNYLGEQEEVTVPKKWLSDPDHVVAELAYITPREKKILLDIDLYGSLDGKPNNAPGGLDSLQGDMGTISRSSGGGTGNTTGGSSSGGGGGRQDAESQYGGSPYDSSQNVSDRGTGFTYGANSPTVPDNDNYQDRIQRIASGTEPGFRPQDDRPFGLSKEEAYRQGRITKDQYEAPAVLESQFVDERSPFKRGVDNVLDFFKSGGILGNVLGGMSSFSEGLQQKAMTFSLNKRLSDIYEDNPDFEDYESLDEIPGEIGAKVRDLESDLQGVRDGTFKQSDFTAKYGSGDATNPLDASFNPDLLSDRDQRNLQNLFTPELAYAVSGQTPQDSMVNQYFNNMNMNQGSPLSSNLQTDYNNAKNSINSILGILPPSQQFGFSADPYGGLMASNLTTNPFNIDYLRRLGLI